MSGQSPIYTRSDLAELITQHDQEHPDHGRTCDCANGLIKALRTYFAPAEPATMDVPRPYVPPFAQPPKPAEDASERRPWLKQRDGETQAEYDHRISHSCYNCGRYIKDRDKLNQHEDQCSQQGRRTTTENEGTLPGRSSKGWHTLDLEPDPRRGGSG